jgi:hypothetical protein
MREGSALTEEQRKVLAEGRSFAFHVDALVCSNVFAFIHCHVCCSISHVTECFKTVFKRLQFC